MMCLFLMLKWRPQQAESHLLDLCIFTGLEIQLVQCRGQVVSSTKQSYLAWMSYSVTLLLPGKAVGHLLSVLSFFFRGILLLPSSSSAQPSVVCSPLSSTCFLFSISTGGSLPPAPLGFFPLLLPPLP